MASVRLLPVMLFFTWISTSNALRSTGNKGHDSIGHVDRQDNDFDGLWLVDNDAYNFSGGVHGDDEFGFDGFPGNGVVYPNPNGGVHGDDVVIPDIFWQVVSGIAGEVILSNPNSGVNGDDEVDVDSEFDDTDGTIHYSNPAVVVDYGYDDVINETDYIEDLNNSYPGVVVDYTFTLFVVNPQDQVLVSVDNATADNILKSHLTTIFLPILYIIVFVVGLPANTMALWVFLFRTKEKHPSTIYMANLALSDVLFVIWIPLKIAYHFNGNDWIFGEGLCKVLVGFFYGNMYCSILFIAWLSVQRCRVVVDPFSEQNNKVAIGVCVSIWVFIWTTTIPLYQYGHTVRVIDLNITTCHDVNAIWDINDPFASVKYPYYYFMLMASVVFLIPCIVIVVAYVLMFWYLEKKMVRNVNRTAENNRHKALVLIVTVLVTFLVCFIPSNIMLVIHYYLLSIGEINNGYGFYISTLCLSSLNSCLDPFIYYFVSDDFKKHVKNTLLCRSRRTVESIESANPSSPPPRLHSPDSIQAAVHSKLPVPGSRQVVSQG